GRDRERRRPGGDPRPGDGHDAGGAARLARALDPGRPLRRGGRGGRARRLPVLEPGGLHHRGGARHQRRPGDAVTRAAAASGREGGEAEATRLLTELGLAVNEARVYLALLRFFDSPTAAEAASAAGVPRPKVYEALQALEGR